MRVARDTHRSVLSVAHDSFALTLWTLWHLHQLDTYDLYLQGLQQYDLASLFAFASHNPKKLDDLRDRFIILYSASLVSSDEQLRKAQQHVIAHRSMIPIAPH